MVIFHKETARGHRSPFGIGKILEIRADKTIHYQWYGNYFYNANGIFKAGWYNEREGLRYDGRKASRLDVPWTGEHTEETLTADLIIAIGNQHNLGSFDLDTVCFQLVENFTNVGDMIVD